MKVLVAVALVAAFFVAPKASAPSLAFAPDTGNRAITNDLIPMIRCRDGLGTGIRIAPHRVLTAAHVASIGDCTINGEPVVPIMFSYALDVAVVETSPKTIWSPVNCEPLRLGAKYDATGYAGGGPLYRQEVFGAFHVSTPASVWPKFGGAAMYVGREKFIPGMSGGPITNDRGQLVGIVVGYDRRNTVSYGRSLADTPLCGAPDA